MEMRLQQAIAMQLIIPLVSKILNCTHTESFDVYCMRSGAETAVCRLRNNRRLRDNNRTVICQKYERLPE